MRSPIHPRPPRVAEWLLHRIVPFEARDAAIGDLNEEFADLIGASHSNTTARRWYWRQAISLGFAFGHARVRDALPRRPTVPRSDLMRQDLRDALRSLARNPVHTFVTIVVLALGIGATSAIFSFVDDVLLKPLPYDAPDRMVTVWEKSPTYARNAVSTNNFLDWQQATDAFDAIAAVSGNSVSLSGASEPQQVQGARVSAGYFDVFRVKAALGRTFRPGEDIPGNDRVAVISHRLWEQSFGSDPAIIGRAITIDRVSHTIVGVMPAASAFDRGRTDVWQPFVFGPDERTRNFHWLQVMARLNPGVTLDAARTRMETIAARIADDYPDSNKGWSITIDPYRDLVFSADLRQSLKVLLAAVSALLLVACANLANLALARGTAREREVVIRAALGASRLRLLRQFLTENLLLAFAGGLAGVAAGHAMLDGLKILLPPFYLPREALVTLDMRAVLFALTISIVTGLLFGIAPAIQAGNVDLAGPMTGTGRTTTADRTRRRLRNSLVVVELALTCMLLAGSALLIRSFMRLHEVETVPDPETLLTAGIHARFDDPDIARAIYRRVLARTQIIPGVRSVSLTSALPLQGWSFGMPFRIEGQPGGISAERDHVGFKIVSSDYFKTVGLPILNGRGLLESDLDGARRVVVVNQAMADRVFPNENPIGKRLLVQRIAPGSRVLGEEVAWEIVGVVANERVDSLSSPYSDGMYATLEQFMIYPMGLAIRTAGAAGPTALALKTAVQEVDPDLPLARILTVDQIRRQSVAPDRLRTWLVGVFSALALLLAAVGVYGVISYSVALQTHEIGVRAALGATRNRLVVQVMRSAATLTLAGLVLGLLAALAVGGVLRSLLFGISPWDAISLAGAAATLGTVALFAAWAPARRAASIDAIEALRVE